MITYLDHALSEELLDKVPIGAEHACVVDSEASTEQLNQLLVP